MTPLPSSTSARSGGVPAPAPALAVEPEALALDASAASGADGPVGEREPDPFLAALRAGTPISFALGTRTVSAPVGCERCGDVTAALNPKHNTSCPCACHVAAQHRKDQT